jgi:hypothetical protein
VKSRDKDEVRHQAFEKETERTRNGEARDMEEAKRIGGWVLLKKENGN